MEDKPLFSVLLHCVCIETTCTCTSIVAFCVHVLVTVYYLVYVLQAPLWVRLHPVAPPLVTLPLCQSGISGYPSEHPRRRPLEHQRPGDITVSWTHQLDMQLIHPIWYQSKNFIVWIGGRLVAICVCVRPEASSLRVTEVKYVLSLLSFYLSLSLSLSPSHSTPGGDQVYVTTSAFTSPPPRPTSVRNSFDNRPIEEQDWYWGNITK